MTKADCLKIPFGIFQKFNYLVNKLSYKLLCIVVDTSTTRVSSVYDLNLINLTIISYGQVEFLNINNCKAL